MRYRQLFQDTCTQAVRLAQSRPAAYAALPIFTAAGFLTGMGLVTAYGEAQGLDLPDRLLLTKDGSWSEKFEYLLTAISCIAMVLTWRKAGSSVYLVLAIMFAWLTIDNSLELHERVGGWLAPAITWPGSSPGHAQHYGELLLFAGVGLASLLGLALALMTAAPWHQQRTALLIILIGAAAVFGVGVDALDALLLGSMPQAQQIGTFIEDAGELWMLCIIAVFSIAILCQTIKGEEEAGSSLVSKPSRSR